MPSTSASPNPGETTTPRSCTVIVPIDKERIVAVRTGMRPLAVEMIAGKLLSSRSTPIARAVAADKAVVVAPVSTSIRRVVPLSCTRAQK